MIRSTRGRPTASAEKRWSEGVQHSEWVSGETVRRMKRWVWGVAPPVGRPCWRGYGGQKVHKLVKFHGATNCPWVKSSRARSKHRQAVPTPSEIPHFLRPPRS